MCLPLILTPVKAARAERSIVLIIAGGCVGSDTASNSEHTDMTCDGTDSTSGRTDADRQSEVVVSLTSAQRTNIRHLLERQAQLLMVRFIDVKNVQIKIKNVKNVKNVTKIKNVCKR